VHAGLGGWSFTIARYPPRPRGQIGSHGVAWAGGASHKSDVHIFPCIRSDHHSFRVFINISITCCVTNLFPDLPVPCKQRLRSGFPRFHSSLGFQPVPGARSTQLAVPTPFQHIFRMVFFVCDGCQESLRKASVAKHASMCRRCETVTCVDCGLSFLGDDYAQHTTCISEAAKYEKSLYRPKQGGSAKRDPQAEWTACIAEAAEASAPGPTRDLLSRLVEYTNVPRKLKPFLNFAQNSLKYRNEPALTKVFEAVSQVSAAKRPPQAAGAGAGSAAAATEDADGDAEMKGSGAAASAGDKRKASSGGDDDADGKGEDDDGAASSRKKAKTAEEAGAGAGGAGIEALRTALKDALKAAKKEAGGEGGESSGLVKVKSLRKRLVSEAVEAGTVPGKGQGKEAFGEALQALVDAGKAKLDESGKYVRRA
jgi:cell growth-regulating nucleolar protein